MAGSKLVQFRGALVGAVIGDCLGAPFEGRLPHLTELLRFYEKTDTTVAGISLYGHC